MYIKLCLSIVIHALSVMILTPPYCRRTPWRATGSYVSPEAALGTFPLGPLRPVNIDLWILPKFCFIHSLLQPRKRDRYKMLCGRCLTFLKTGPENIPDTTIVIIVPTDGLAPLGARPSEATTLMIKLYNFSSRFSWFSVIPFHLWWPDDAIQNGWQDLKISPHSEC